jgi:hypothetical protein
MSKPIKKLGDALIEKRLITEQDLQEALKAQAKTGEYLGKTLIRMGLIKDKDLLLIISEQLNMPLVSMKNQYIDWATATKFTASLILDYKCLPFKMDKSYVTVAVINPFDAWALAKVEEEARGYKINFVLVTESDMDDAISRYKKYVGNSTLKQI